MNNAKDAQAHAIRLDMRKNMEISGVCEVVSFDDTGAILTTVCGELTAEGRGIKINVLDTERGVVTLEGDIDAIYYSDNDERQKKGLFGRLLK